MAKIMLAASLIMGLSYATEWFAAWYRGEHADRWLVIFKFTGTYAPLFWALLACNVVIAAAVLVAPHAPQHRAPSVVIAILINVGMWLERILIVWNTLSHGFLPSHVAYPSCRRSGTGRC